MTDDDGFERWLQDAARGYHEPPATPRDAMWQAVQAGRVRSAPAAMPRRSRIYAVAALAATLVLGVTIGRWSSAARRAPTRPVAVAVPGHAPSAPDSIATPGTNALVPNTGTTAIASAPQHQAAPAPRMVAALPELHGRSAAERDSLAYRDAALRHLTDAEAMLTSFRAEAGQGQVRGDVSAWATDLLSTTRLLLDSPAADDRTMKPLLEDLELVLAQIARLHAGSDSTDVDMAQKALRQHDMIPRIRAVPGAQSSGT